MATSEQRFERLRAAVKAYAEGLKRYALFGSAWVEHSEELDELWAAVLDAAELPTD